MTDKALKEIQQYRSLEKRLSDMFGGELSLSDVVNELERYLKEPDNSHPINAKILTYEDAAKWEAYKAIGTVDECRDAVEKQKPHKWERGIENDVRCPFCGTMTTKIYEHRYCSFCGQRLE